MQQWLRFCEGCLLDDSFICFNFSCFNDVARTKGRILQHQVGERLVTNVPMFVFVLLSMNSKWLGLIMEKRNFGTERAEDWAGSVVLFSGHQMALCLFWGGGGPCSDRGLALPFSWLD